MNVITFVFLTSILWGIGQVLIKKGFSYLTPWQTYTLDTLSAILIWIPFGLWSTGFSIPLLTPVSLIVALFLGALYAFYYAIIEKGPISIISPIFSTAPVITALLARIFLHEQLSIIQMCAIISTVFGVILLSLPHSKEHFKHILSWIVSTLLLTLAFGFEPIASKYALKDSGNGTFMILFALGQLVAVLIWYFIKRPKKIIPKIKKRYFLPSLLGVFMFNAGTISWAKALESGFASVVTSLSNSYIVILVIFSAYYLKEKITRRQWVGIAFVILGVIFVNDFSSKEPTNNVFLFAENRILTTEIPRVDAHVSYVIDGDTFILTSGEKVRLIGIDAPETPKDSTADCFGTQAAKMLSTLILNQEIELETDTLQKDTYGRLLRYVYQNNVFINQFLVEQGFAKTMNIPPDTRYASLIASSQKTAQAHLRGLWKDCPNSPLKGPTLQR